MVEVRNLKGIFVCRRRSSGKRSDDLGSTGYQFESTGIKN